MRVFSHLDSNTAAADNFPGLSFFIYLAETSPFTKFLVIINLRKIKYDKGKTVCGKGQ